MGIYYNVSTVPERERIGSKHWQMTRRVSAEWKRCWSIGALWLYEMTNRKKAKQKQALTSFLCSKCFFSSIVDHCTARGSRLIEYRHKTRASFSRIAHTIPLQGVVVAVVGFLFCIFFYMWLTFYFSRHQYIVVFRLQINFLITKKWLKTTKEICWDILTCRAYKSSTPSKSSRCAPFFFN